MVYVAVEFRVINDDLVSTYSFGHCCISRSRTADISLGHRDSIGSGAVLIGNIEGSPVSMRLGSIP